MQLNYFRCCGHDKGSLNSCLWTPSSQLSITSIGACCLMREGANSVHRAGKGLKCNDQISLDQPILTSLELSVNLYLNLVYNSSRLIVEQTTNNSHQTPTLKYKNRTMTCLRTQSQGCVAKWIIYGIMFVKLAISNLGSSLELAWNS